MPSPSIQPPEHATSRGGDWAARPLLVESVRPALSWVVLAMLLLALLVAAATLDRRDWPGLIGDEAAYLMQAESLAHDFDARYSRADYERFVGHWQRPPEGLILQSGDGGQTLTYGKPAPYSLWLAPFVRFAPVRGPAIANTLLLALAALAAAWTLRPAVGASAPLWVAAAIFASVMFANVFWAHADLFLACLTAIAFALVFWPPSEWGEPAADTRRARRLSALRWALAGALLAVVVLSRPLYAPLLLPAVWVAFRAGRGASSSAPRRAWIWLLAGAALLTATTVAASLPVRGSWTPYGGERMGFYSYTGFPEVDLANGGWQQELAERPGSGSWVERRKLRFSAEPRLWAYDSLYFVAGSHVGVAPYFLPAVLLVLLALLHRRARRSAWPLVLAVAATVVAFFVIRPFNFYGGGAALANRYFLPVYPALWFVLCRVTQGRRQAPELSRPAAWGAPLLAALLAGPFLWPLWTAATAFPIAEDGSWRYVSSLATRLLPYETTLDHLKPAGREDLMHGTLWIKRLDRGLTGPDEGTPEGWLRSEPPGGEALIGSRKPLERLRVYTRRGGATLRFSEATDVQSLGASAVGSLWELTPRETARHRMWWSERDVYLYRLRFSSEVPVPLRLEPVLEQGDSRGR